MQFLSRPVAILLLLFFVTACKKENQSIDSGLPDNDKNNPGNNTNLTADEADLVGTWIAKDFYTDGYDEDTVYVQTSVNQQGYRNRTLVLKNDLNYSMIDSFRPGNFVQTFQGKWNLQNGILNLEGHHLGKGKLNKISDDNFETTVGYFPYGFSCGNDSSGTYINGFITYRYNYKRY